MAHFVRTAMLWVALLASPAFGDDHWLPIQVRAGAQGQLSTTGQTTFGAALEAAWVTGVPDTTSGTQRSGHFLGAALGVFFGSTDLERCAGVPRCAERKYLYAGPRIGLATADDTGDVIWPDLYAWLQVSPLIGYETLPSRPLQVAGNEAFWGARLDIGFTALAWTTTLLEIGGHVSTSSSSNSLSAGLALLLLGLLNSATLSFEYSTHAFSTAAVRFGITLGTGF